ncbi:HEAT repeat domain-containing protein [bacterium]|nr:HEAT repeat domain-containing protein [bacterium]
MGADLSKILEYLRNSHAEVQLIALTTLKQVTAREVRELGDDLGRIQAELMPLQDHKEPDVRNLSKQALDHIQSLIQVKESKDSEATGVNWCVQDLQSSEPSKRAACVLGLANVRDPKSYSSILNLLIEESNPEVLAASVKALGLIGSQKTVNLLEVFLYHEDSRVRVTAVESIRTLGSAGQVLLYLIPMIIDPHQKVQISALKAIESLELSVILSELNRMVTATELLTRANSLQALSCLCGDSILELLNLAARDPHTSIRFKSIDILANFGDTKVLPILTRLSQDVDIEVSERALRALEEFQPTSNVRLLDLSNLMSAPKDSEKVTGDEKEESGKAGEDSTDQGALDQELDALLLEIGKMVYSYSRDGLLMEDEFVNLVLSIERNETLLKKQREKSKDKGVVDSVKKAFGGSFDQELALRRINLTVEESYLELGMKAFELSQKREPFLPGFEEKLARVSALFSKLNQQDNDPR